MPAQSINRDTVSGEALFILKNLRENGRLGRSNKLADVKTALEPAVSLEFDNYFFFLRKFHYIAMDREAQLKLTEHGERVAEGEQLDSFTEEVGQFFSDQLNRDTTSSTDASSLLEDLRDDLDSDGGSLPPPPPSRYDDDDDAPDEIDEALREPEKSVTPPPPPPPSRRRNAAPEEAAAPPPPLPGSAAASASSASSASGGAKGTDLDLRYAKFDPLGVGPIGTVHKGRQHSLGTDVAVKELKDIFGYFSFLQRGEVVKRLKRELCAQAQVHHPGVLNVLDQNTDVARPYFVTELMTGSLKEKLEANAGKGFPIQDAVRWFLQLSYGLRAAHAQGLFHHNLKPENVLFDSFGNVKLSDFGLARVIEVDSSKGMPQIFVGTGGMNYLAPELMNRQKDAGASADVYGLGILLYEMLTGQVPGRRSPLPSEVNTQVPSKLDPLFDRMTHDKKDQRYADFDAMLEDFYGAFSDGEYLASGDLILSSKVNTAAP